MPIYIKVSSYSEVLINDKLTDKWKFVIHELLLRLKIFRIF